MWGEKSMYGKKYMGILRSAFLIDEKGKIAEAWYKISPKDTPANLLEALGEVSDPLPTPIDVLPHRPPFLFVDEITALEPGRVGRAAAGISRATSAFFAGHFPGRPTLPGVLMAESIAQLGAVAVLTDAALRGQAAAVRRARRGRFRRQVVPGDTLELEVELAPPVGTCGAGAAGKASVGGQVACEAELLFVVVDAG